jgi:YceI-like domain
MTVPSRALLALMTLLAPTLVSGQDAVPANARAYAVDRDLSRLYVVVHRAGLLSFLGHEHAIVPRDWSADLCLSDPIEPGAHAALAIRTASLVIDVDSARALAGMGSGPGEDDRQDIQRKMLSASNLAAEEYPEIRVDLRARETPDQDRISVVGQMSLRGVTRDVDFLTDVERREPNELVLTGMLRIRMRDFGIEPESRAGLVKVSNDVDLHFVLAATPTARACPPTGEP